jgi:hypothetical protein
MGTWNGELPTDLADAKWQPGEAVYWRDRLTVWTVQAGPCSAGPEFVHITAPGRSAVAWQDELVLIDPRRKGTRDA